MRGTTMTPEGNHTWVGIKRGIEVKYGRPDNISKL